jgi:hypothetical protein
VNWLALVVAPGLVAIDKGAQCQRQQEHASLDLEFTLILAAKSPFVTPLTNFFSRVDKCENRISGKLGFRQVAPWGERLWRS